MPIDSYYFRLMSDEKTETSNDQNSGLFVSRNNNIDPGVLFISEINKNTGHNKTNHLMSYGKLLAVCYESNKNSLDFQCSRRAKIKYFCISYKFYTKSLPPQNLFEIDKSLWQKFNEWKCRPD